MDANLNPTGFFGVLWSAAVEGGKTLTIEALFDRLMGIGRFIVADQLKTQFPGVGPFLESDLGRNLVNTLVAAAVYGALSSPDSLPKVVRDNLSDEWRSLLLVQVKRIVDLGTMRTMEVGGRALAKGVLDRFKEVYADEKLRMAMFSVIAGGPAQLQGPDSLEALEQQLQSIEDRIRAKRAEAVPVDAELVSE